MCVQSYVPSWLLMSSEARPEAVMSLRACDFRATVTASRAGAGERSTWEGCCGGESAPAGWDAVPGVFPWCLTSASFHNLSGAEVMLSEMVLANRAPRYHC